MQSPTAMPAPRIALIDLARGLALAAMAVYHFSWDLGFLGFADLDVADHPLWIAFARATAGSFLALAGFSLVLAHGERLRARPFLRRLAMIAVAAAAITLGSFYVDPDGVILFGILHAIAVSSVLGLAFLRLPLFLVVGAAAFVLAAPAFLSSPVFNAAGWLWLGLSTEAPPSNDYNPLLPWFGMVLLGIAAARIAPAFVARAAWLLWQPHSMPTRLIVLAGRHSLLVYLVHQPILLGILWSVAQMAAIGG